MFMFPELKPARIVGLDTWRAILLLGGPLVHSIDYGWVAASPVRPLDTIAQGSHLFRVAAFFAIAGYLAALNQAKPDWLASRMRQLVIPIISGSLLTLFIVYELWMCGLVGSMNWGALPGPLWFLISLAIVTPLLPWLDKIGVNQRIAAWANGRVLAFLATALIVTLVVNILCTMFGWLFLQNVVQFGDLPVILLVKTPSNLCFYLLGFYCARIEACTAFLRATHLWVVSVAIWVLALILFWYTVEAASIPHANRELKTAMLGLTVLTEFVMSLAILSIALKMKRTSRIVRPLSRAAYSIFVLHMPFIWLLIPFVQGADPGIGPYAMYTTLVVGSLVLSYATHILLIERSPALSLLFNGKRLARDGAADARVRARAFA